MKIKLRNRLEVLMKDSGITTFEEMAQRITQNQGMKITRTALSRKFRDDDVTLSLSMIQAICNELQCLPGDLFETDISEASPQFLDELRTRLQPFRYGVIRLQKPGGEQTESTQAAEVTSRGAPTKAATAKETGRPKTDPADYDDVVGPAVSHLHIGKLKT